MRIASVSRWSCRPPYGLGRIVRSRFLADIKASYRRPIHRQFLSIVCCDRLAETTAEYAKKGDPLCVEGRLQYRSFQDEEGKERGSCEIIADDVQFLSRRGTGQRG